MCDDDTAMLSRSVLVCLLGVVACRDDEDATGAQAGGTSTSDTGGADGAEHDAAGAEAGDWGLDGAASSDDAADEDVGCSEVVAGDLVLASRDDVLGAAHVREVAGSLWIEGEVDDLAPLACLQRVGSNLLIRDTTALADLSGLSALDYVGGGISAWGNVGLTSLAGLSALRHVPSITLRHNALTTLGLTELQALGWLSIGDCGPGTGEPNLEALDTLGSLIALDAVSVQGSPSLAALPALHDFADRGGRDVALHFWWDTSLAPETIEAARAALETPAADVCGVMGQSDENCWCPPPP